MFYLYLPTSWCKQYGITSDSKVSLSRDNAGNLIIAPKVVEQKKRVKEFDLAENDLQIVHKVLMACYVNPLYQFKINLKKELDFSKLLQQKRLISIETIEIDKKQISSDGNVQVENPTSLLKTMIRKTKNLLYIMMNNYEPELMGRYEEEIDRSKILIDKSMISALAEPHLSKMKAINLYYISMVSRNIERLVDHLLHLKKEDSSFLHAIAQRIEKLKDIMEGIESEHTLTYEKAVEFIKSVLAIKQVKVSDLETYDKQRIRQYLIGISEVLIDWAITKEIDLS